MQSILKFMTSKMFLPLVKRSEGFEALKERVLDKGIFDCAIVAARGSGCRAEPIIVKRK